MIYNPLYSGWYFSYVEIPEFNEIKKELLELHLTGIKSYQSNTQYYNVLKQDIVSCPTLFEYLDKKKLLKKFVRILFSTNVPRQDVAHVDGYDLIARNHFSLNLPLIDCEQSYTVFYKFDGKQLLFNKDTYKHYAWMTMDKIEEIARVECTKPVLVNTTILHKGVTDKLSRTLACVRFNSPLTIDEMKELGIKNPLVQEDV